MAERRMLSKSISVSEKVNDLPDIFDMLLYTWMIPHSDDYGRMTGSSAKVRALVIPMLNKTNEDVERSLLNLHKSGLIQWYEVASQKFIQINNFEEHQSGLHKRTKPKFPDPPVDSGNFPEVPESSPRIELNRTEQKGKEEKKPLSVSTDDVESIILFLNERAGRMFRNTDANRKEIKARMKKGAKVEECKLVIDWKVSKWSHDPEMAKNLNPTTLFRASNFDRYLDEAREELTKREQDVGNILASYACGEDQPSSPFASGKRDYAREAEDSYFGHLVK